MWRTLQKQNRGAKQREKTTPIQGAKFSHDGNQGANSSVQRVGISHTSIQGAKFPVQGVKISHGKILSSKNFKLTFKLKFYPPK